MARGDPHDPDRIRSQLHARWLGSRVIVYDTTASTNDVAAEYARSPASHGLVILAEEQTAGRGRGANPWLSTRGQSLLVSTVIIDPALPPGLLSLTASVAVVRTVGSRARIKWPNDVILLGRKVCGILLEQRKFPGHSAAILGLGVNCHQQPGDFPPSLQASAISLDMAGPGRTDRDLWLCRLLLELEAWLARAERDAETVIAAWKESCLQFGHRVALRHDGRRYDGQCLGVDPDQGLILKLDHGGIRYFPAAQSHVIREDNGAGANAAQLRF
jgi:BirA family biotin operon repressor/biotin-[acetyl-CoA-carboxylase] ligase